MWKKYFELSVASYMQRISLTGSLPPFVMNAFLAKSISDKSTKTIRATTNRPEVGLIVVEVNQRTSMLRNARALVMTLEDELAERDRILVFFQSAAECERFSRDYGSAQYHSKLPAFGAENKQGNLDRWDAGETKVLAATTAAALGVDRPYVKFVVVVEGTYGLLTFAQEIGRGGRRGQQSYGILLRDPHKYHCPSKKDFKGTRDKRDVGAEMAFHVYATNVITCRRLVLLDTMDGPAMCHQRRQKTKCEHIPGCNYCDVCSPTGRIVTLAKEAIDRAHFINFTNPQTTAPAPQFTTAAAVARGSTVKAIPTPRISGPPKAGPSTHSRTPAPRVPTPPPVAGPSRIVPTPSQESDYFDELTSSMLAQFDAIDDMHKVSPPPRN